MTEKEKVTLGVIANDVKWIKKTLEDDCSRIGKLEKLVYIGLGICLAGEFLLGWIK